MRIIKADGTPFETGRAVGVALKENIAFCLAGHPTFTSVTLPLLQTAKGKALFEELLHLHVRLYPGLVEEIRGLAEGSGQPFERLFALNTFGEHLRRVQGEKGCSTLCVVNKAKILFGHNEDGGTFYRGHACLLEVQQPGKPGFTAFCYPGYLPGGGFGFNRAGVCVACNTVTPEESRVGAGRLFIARSLLDADSLAQAFDKIKQPIHASGFHYTIGSVRERKIIAVESNGESHDLVTITGVYYHANHYVHQKAEKQEGAPSSLARQARAERLLAAGEDDVLKILSDREGDYPIFNKGTLATALYDLDGKEALVSLRVESGRAFPLLP